MKSISRNLIFTALASFIPLVGGLATSANAQVVNGGFETGDFTGWTVVDPSGFTNVGNDPLFAHSGMYHANLGASPNVGTLTETFTTTPGQTYTFAFWLANDGAAGGGEVNQFDALWNGTPVLTQTNVPVSLYTQYSFSLVAPTASTTIEFDYRNDDDFFRLDDVSATLPVPEPSAMWLGLSGVALLGAFRFCRRSSKA
jgi:hypothetical protein